MATIPFKTPADPNASFRTTIVTGTEHIPHQRIVDGTDAALGVSGNPLHVTTGTVLDYDSDSGTVNLPVIGIAIPSTTGPVIAGTSANPLEISHPSIGAVDVPEATADGTIVAILKRIRTLLSGFLNVTPQMSSGGHISAQTNAAGANWTPFASQACKQMLFSNNTGVTIEVSVGGTGVGMPLPPGSIVPFYGLTNCSNLSVRRVDQSGSQVTIAARWES